MTSQNQQIQTAIEKSNGQISRWILRLGKEKGEFEPWYMDSCTFNEDLYTFICCLNLRRAHKAVEQRMSEAKKLRTFKKREEKKAKKIPLTGK
jgi:hypothetical protein